MHLLQIMNCSRLVQGVGGRQRPRRRPCRRRGWEL